MTTKTREQIIEEHNAEVLHVLIEMFVAPAPQPVPLTKHQLFQFFLNSQITTRNNLGVVTTYRPEDQFADILDITGDDVPAIVGEAVESAEDPEETLKGIAEELAVYARNLHRVAREFGNLARYSYIEREDCDEDDDEKPRYRAPVAA